MAVGADGLVTWTLGTVTNAAGSIEMVVKFPEAPAAPDFDANGELIETEAEKFIREQLGLKPEEATAKKSQ